MFSCTVKGKNCWNRRRHLDVFRRGACAAGPPVHGNEIGTAFQGEIQILFQKSCGDLHPDGTPVRNFTQPVDFRFQLLRRRDVLVVRGTQNVGSGRKTADSGNFVRYFASGQMTAHAGLGGLSEFDLNRIHTFQVFLSYAVTVRNILKNVTMGIADTLLNHAAFTGTHRRLNHCRAFRQRRFRLAGQCAE